MNNQLWNTFPPALSFFLCPITPHPAGITGVLITDIAGGNRPPCWIHNAAEFFSINSNKPTQIHSHYNDVIMGTLASQITGLTIVYSTLDLDADQRKHQSSASLAFVRGIHREPVNSPHKWLVTRKMFPFDDVIMIHQYRGCLSLCGYLSCCGQLCSCSCSGVQGTRATAAPTLT